jgi:hypothetical protein
MRGVGSTFCIVIVALNAGCSTNTPAANTPAVEEPMPADGGLFTPAAQELFRAANDAADRLGHFSVIGTDDLLVAFLTEPRFRPPGVPSLEKQAVLKLAGELYPPFPDMHDKGQPHLRSPKVMEVINRAVDVARTTNAPIGLTPEHLWAGLLLHGSEAVRAILAGLGLDRQALLNAAGVAEP